MNLNTDDPVGARNRAILFGVVTLVVLGIVVGLSVGWLGSRAVDSTGIDEVEAPEGDQPDGNDDPFDDFTASPSEPEDTEETTEPTEPTETTPASPTEPTKTKKTREPREPTLNASPATADTNQQVSLTGRFPGLGAGVTLEVERKEGGEWASFYGVTATTDPGGTYSTWIETGQTGPNRFRLTAPSGESTPIVVVQIV